MSVSEVISMFYFHGGRKEDKLGLSCAKLRACFGLPGFDLVWLVWYSMFGLVGLILYVLKVFFGRFDFESFLW